MKSAIVVVGVRTEENVPEGGIVSLPFDWVTALCRTRTPIPFVCYDAVHRGKAPVDCVSMDASPQ
jgi:hypothetical protein